MEQNSSIALSEPEEALAPVQEVLPAERPPVSFDSSAWRRVLIGAAALIIGLGLPLLIWVLARPLALVLLAIVIAQALSPLVDRLERRLSRPTAVTIVYVIFAAILGVAGYFAFAPLVGQIQDVLNRLPALIDLMQSWLSRQNELLRAVPLASAVETQLQSLGTNLLSLPLSVVGTLLEATLVIFLSAYWLGYSKKLKQFILSLAQPSYRPKLDVILNEMGQTVGGYARGVTINVLIIGVLTYIGLLLLGVENALALAIFSGLMEVIPVIGSLIGGIAIVGVALTQSFTLGLIVLVFVLVLQQVEGNLLTPVVMRSQTEIPQPLILAALATGGAIAGLLGALVAIPLAGALYVMVRRIIAPTIRRWTGAADPVPAEQ